jgi:sigma-B regulation protein RsbU (phosphoserine phosphatase)
MLFFKSKKPDPSKEKEVSQENIDLQIINKMNQEFAMSLDLDETLNTALKLIIKRLNAQAANIFLINNRTKKFECIASQNQNHLDEYQLDLKDGVMGKAVEQKKCIRVGDVRKDVREIAEFYFDLDNKTNFTTFSVLCSPLIAANDCIGVIHCLNKKTDDKLFKEDDRELLELLSTPAALAIRNAKMALEMVEQNKMQKEVQIVGEIQKSLLSSNKKEPFPLAGINIPAKVISGDFYNFNDLGDGKYGFGVADVSGKGIKSSLLMSKASSLYSCLSKTNFSPAELLIQLNNEICETISRGMFVTMLIGIYDKNNKELLIANAGHEPPIILNDKNEFSNFNESGPPLGIVKETKYEEYKIKFENSSMYIFTDGITEIKNPEGEELGSVGFQKYITKYKDKPNNERLKLIIENIMGYKYIQKDDLTVVVLDS